MGKNSAILIVNGGQEPKAGRWLELCLNKVRANTQWLDYHLYVWNNNVDDSWVGEFTAAFSNLTLITADPDEILAHKHAVPLHRLYERARQDGCHYIVAMDSDAHPIRSGWLVDLITALDEGAVLAGVWRDELRGGIRPYIHASCLATTVSFIEENELRLDFIAPKNDANHDTLSNLTDKALNLKASMHRWPRSNANNIHRLIGGVYGDFVYHHGAGSRPGAQFWDEGRNRALYQENKRIRDLSGQILFKHYDPYLAWLRGTNRPNFIFVLGMPQSGTNLIAGSLERCGVNFVDGNRARNNEQSPVGRLHREILAANGGSWSEPPSEIILDDEQRQAMREIVTGMEQNLNPNDVPEPVGLKNPDTLLLLDAWLELTDNYALIGTFRHPVAVALSLKRRNEMPAEQAYELWLTYNRRLVDLHQRFGLPIIEFDLTDTERYCQSVAALALELGLQPDLEALNQFVSGKLDHSDLVEAAVPDKCQDVYDYLKNARYQPDLGSDSFGQMMLQLNVSFSQDDLSIRQEMTETLRFLAQYLPRPLTLQARRLLQPLLRKLR